LADAALTSQIV